MDAKSTITPDMRSNALHSMFTAIKPLLRDRLDDRSIIEMMEYAEMNVFSMSANSEEYVVRIREGTEALANKISLRWGHGIRAAEPQLQQGHTFANNNTIMPRNNLQIIGNEFQNNWFRMQNIHPSVITQGNYPTMPIQQQQNTNQLSLVNQPNQMQLTQNMVVPQRGLVVQSGYPQSANLLPEYNTEALEKISTHLHRIRDMLLSKLQSKSPSNSNVAPKINNWLMDCNRHMQCLQHLMNRAAPINQRRRWLQEACDFLGLFSIQTNIQDQRNVAPAKPPRKRKQPVKKRNQVKNNTGVNLATHNVGGEKNESLNIARNEPVNDSSRDKQLQLTDNVLDHQWGPQEGLQQIFTDNQKESMVENNLRQATLSDDGYDSGSIVKSVDGGVQGNTDVLGEFNNLDFLNDITFEVDPEMDLFLDDKRLEQYLKK